MGRSAAHSSPAFLGLMAAFAIPGLFLLAGVSAQVEDLSAAERLLQGLGLQAVDNSPAPLSMMITHLFAALPLGPLTLRVAAGFALLTAVAAALLYVAMLAVVRKLELREDEVAVPMCVGVSWLVCASDGMWSLAMGGATHAVALCLAAFVLIQLQSLAGDQLPQHASTRSMAKTLGWTAVSLCLLGWEAPLWAAVVWIATVIAWRGHSVMAGLRRPLLLALSLGLIPGFLVVLKRLLDARAQMAVVVESTVAQSAVAGAVRRPWTLTLLVVACVAAVVASRTAAREQLRPWLWVGGLSLGCMALEMPFVELVVTLWPLVLFAGALAVIASLALLLRRRHARPSALSLLLGVALCTLGFLELQRVSRQTMQRASFSTDILAEETLFVLKPKSLVLLTSHDAQVLLLWANLTMGSRPDLVFLPLDVLNDASMVNRVVADMPELRPLAASLLLSGHLQLSELQSLAGQRPVALELADRDIDHLYEATRPTATLYELLPGGTSREDVAMAAVPRAELYERLYNTVEVATLAPVMAAFLRSRHRVDALHAMRIGARTAAHDAIDAGLIIAPGDGEFAKMRSYLADHAQDTNLDIRPWVDGS